MLVSLAVERSNLEYQASSAALAYLDPAVMEQAGLAAGSLIRVTTFWGRTIWARVGPAQEEDRRGGLIRLDRFQRQSLKARRHESVDVFAEPEQPVTRVYLQPSVDLFTAKSHHIEEHLKEELVENRTPVCDGQLLFAHFEHSVAGLLYRVRKTEDGPGVVSESTEVVLEPAPQGFADDLSLDVTFDDVGGLDSEVRLVRELIQIPLQFPSVYRQLGIQPPRGVIFYGPPGTGKTHLAKAMANELNAQFFYVNGPELIGTMYAETEGNLRKMFSEATHHAPSVIFIDELDVMAPPRGETGSHSDTRMVTQLLSLMDGMRKVEGVVVVGTTNRVEAVDRALRRPGRFDREIYIGPPSEHGRLQILEIHTREMPLSAAAREYLPELARLTHGFVGADLMELSREAGLNALRRELLGGNGKEAAVHQIAYEQLRVERDDLARARSHIHPSATREALVDFSDVGFEEVGGLGQVKEELLHHVRVRQHDTDGEFEAERDGVLLFGPPGTGKSLLAKAVSKECGIALIVVNGPELFTKWLGESEEAVRHVFLVARQLAPCILFFDQLDAVAPIRGLESGSRTTERVVSQLLSELDALDASPGVIALAATNRLDLIDPSLLRPGRFGIHLEVPLPDREDRRQILQLHLSKLELSEALTPELLDWLTDECEGLSGAELRRICQDLRRLAHARPAGLTRQDLELPLQRSLAGSATRRSGVKEPAGWS
jgi:transitional endoplasmic reticulum ATPase